MDENTQPPAADPAEEHLTPGGNPAVEENNLPFPAPTQPDTPTQAEQSDQAAQEAQRKAAEQFAQDADNGEA
jgi:hypothetical protein